MERALLSVALGVCSVAAACFNPDIDFCAPCAGAGSCAESAACVAGFCVFDDQRCVPRVADGASPEPDAAVQNGAATDPSCPGAKPGEPQRECWDQCCIGDLPYSFPDSVKEGLVLWLDGSYLPGLAPGDPLDRWSDRSSGKHDARAPLTPARVGERAVQIQDTSQVLAVAHHARHDLGPDDFVLLLAFSLTSPRQYQCLIAKTVPRQDGFFAYLDARGALTLTLQGDCGVPEGCPRLRIAEPGIAPDRLQLLGIRRIHGARLELRLNREVRAATQLPLDYSLASQAPLGLGSCGAEDSAWLQGSLFATILVRATVGDAELDTLETYLAQAFMMLKGEAGQEPPQTSDASETQIESQ